MINHDWIKELETTDLRQGCGLLYFFGEYCVLGVGAKLVGFQEGENGVGFEGVSSNYEELLEKLGIAPDQVYTIIDWNDKDELNFVEIAEKLKTL